MVDSTGCPRLAAKPAKLCGRENPAHSHAALCHPAHRSRARRGRFRRAKRPALSRSDSDKFFRERRNAHGKFSKRNCSAALGSAQEARRSRPRPGQLARAGWRKIDMRGLTERVNSGIGPPRAVDTDLLAGHLQKCPFQPLLDGVAARLYLPPGKARSVIGDDQFQAPRARGSRRRPLLVRQMGSARGRPGWRPSCRDNFAGASGPPPGRCSRGFP